MALVLCSGAITWHVSFWYQLDTCTFSLAPSYQHNFQKPPPGNDYFSVSLGHINCAMWCSIGYFHFLIVFMFVVQFLELLQQRLTIPSYILSSGTGRKSPRVFCFKWYIGRHFLSQIKHISLLYIIMLSNQCCMGCQSFSGSRKKFQRPKWNWSYQVSLIIILT